VPRAHEHVTRRRRRGGPRRAGQGHPSTHPVCSRIRGYAATRGCGVQSRGCEYAPHILLSPLPDASVTSPRPRLPERWPQPASPRSRSRGEHDADPSWEPVRVRFPDAARRRPRVSTKPRRRRDLGSPAARRPAISFCVRRSSPFSHFCVSSTTDATGPLEIRTCTAFGGRVKDERDQTRRGWSGQLVLGGGAPSHRNGRTTAEIGIFRLSWSISFFSRSLSAINQCPNSIWY
jgi:hypothetical protein